MADVQVARLQYFIHMCITKASAIWITIFKDHRAFMALFLSKMSYSVLTTPKAFWTSILHCLRRAAQWSTFMCWRDVCGPCFWHLQLSEIVVYDWFYSQYWGRIKMLDMASKFLENIEDRCLSIHFFGDSGNLFHFEGPKKKGEFWTAVVLLNGCFNSR